MTADEFVDTMDALKEFLEERGESALGDRFVEMYVNVVEMAVGDCARMVTWFVYENDFGKRGLEAWFDDKPTKITTALQLYYFVLRREENIK
jgi:hypothetical protein